MEIENSEMKNDYEMKISRLVVDKLGVKLYDKVSAVIAEIIANSYDADATEVVVSAPMNKYLAKSEQGKIEDHGHEIIVRDNGHGMTEAIGDQGERQNIECGFELDGKEYPITGWIARSKNNYEDEPMAGARIYRRGKIAAQTPIFNL